LLAFRYTEAAPTAAFAALVFAELLRSFGARSRTMPVWRMPLFANVKLFLVVAVSIGIQLLSQHNALLGRFLKVSPIPFSDGFLLLAAGALPLLVLDVMKVVRSPFSTTKR
jgi:P-type Ca2+ transporter type 2C